MGIALVGIFVIVVVVVIVVFVVTIIGSKSNDTTKDTPMIKPKYKDKK